MGLIAGLVIGLWCRRLSTLLAWCLALAALSSLAFAVGATVGGRVAPAAEFSVLPVLFLIALAPLVASAGATVAIKRLLARRRAARPVRFGGGLSGGA